VSDITRESSLNRRPNIGPAPAVPTVAQLADIFEQLDAIDAKRNGKTSPNNKESV